MPKHYTPLNRCKICGSTHLTEVLRFEDQYLSPTFVQSNEKNALAEIRVPMTLVLCDRERDPDACGLLQLKEMVHPDLLYRQYFYRSATSGVMRRDLQELVQDVLQRAGLQKGDIVVDIGANDCTMLACFPGDLHRIGVEPAKNIDWSHKNPSIEVVNEYFSSRVLVPILQGRKAKVMTATAMFYDLQDPHAVVADIQALLAPDGLLCIQLSYAALMIENLNFYDICNEHLSYYTLRTLRALMERHDLKVVDASTNGVNGGSLRVFITHCKNDSFPVQTARLHALCEKEDALQLTSAATYRAFDRRIRQLGETLRQFILEECRKGHLVLGLGASTKGNVLLQLFGLDKRLIPYISEKNPDKVGLRTLGTDVELIAEEKARSLKPSHMLVLPWYFKEEIVQREQEYLKNGGGLLFPMPYPHMVTREGETRL